ncbi:MAG: ArsR/SmtB family transcription factor [Alphaproteobacteria bacterium]
MLLAGDAVCAAMLAELADGRALTSGELARAAAVDRHTAGAHLSHLAAAGLIATDHQGRHDYHRLAAAEAAPPRTTPPPPRRNSRVVTGPRDPAMRMARTCYGHLAGTLGVALAEALAARGLIDLRAAGAALTEAGIAPLRDFGIAPAALACRPCLDWSERRPHIGGPLGKALAARCFALGWIERIPGGRAVAITTCGRRGFAERFGVAL